MVKWLNEVKGGVELNGRKYHIEYKYYDDEFKKEIVQSLYERLRTTDKVTLLVASYGSTLVLATVPITEKYNKLLVNFGGDTDRIHEQGFKYVVSVWTPASGYLKPAIDMIKVQDPNAKRIAIVFQDDEFSRTFANYTKYYAKNQGFEIVFFKSYPLDVTDLTPPPF
jgi:branched-chain amino acid transport system substrate-binding protein